MTAMNHIFRILLAGALFAVVLPAAEAGKLYKWVDDEGNVHYGDKVPPKYAKEERKVMNDQGVEVDTLEREKTPEEIEAERQAKEREEQREIRREKQRAHDRMLLDTYTSVEDLELARENRVQAVESQIRVTSRNIGNLEKSLAKLEQRIEQVEKNDNPVPEYLKQDYEKTRQDLLDQQRYLMSRQDQVEQIKKQFTEDIARYKKLKSGEIKVGQLPDE